MHLRTRPLIICTACLALGSSSAVARYLDEIGLTELRSRDSSLDGNGVTVAQIEASLGNAWQTDPANTGLDANLFTFYDSGSNYPTGTTFSSSLESAHANRVGSLFYGISSGTQGYDGVSPGVAAIEMFEVVYYYNNSIVAPQISTGANVINQSFVFTSRINRVDEAYDDYAARYNALFVNGIFTDANNDPAVATLITSPASSYNGIAVGVIDDVNLTPLADGRSKPDIVAPSRGGLAAYTSFTTPIVSGAATILFQSGARGDAGAGTADNATDVRTIKSLLLNSAVKPSGWSNTSTRPLDTINGAGILNVNQAQLQLASGEHNETVNDQLTASGAEHPPPTGIVTNVSSNTGWNLGTLANVRQQGQWKDVTDHYFFNCDSNEASSFNLNATLVWNRNLNRTNINNLDLFLYREDGILIASSVSTVDNVEHLYELNLAPGRYVLQVYKPASGRDSNSETYALAFKFEAGISLAGISLAGIPLAADNASATTQSSSEIQLAWNDNAGNETGYRIERRVSGGSFSTLVTLPSGTTSHTDSTCVPGTAYDYQIIAFNESGDAPAAAWASAITYTVQENWRFIHFGTTQATGKAADDADPESDGLVNRIEFATGNDPSAFSTTPIDDSTFGQNRQFSFTWRNNSGLDFSIGYSEDLSTGFSYSTSTTINSGSPKLKLEFIGSTPIDSEFDTLTYGIKASVMTDSAFIKLKVNVP